MTNISLLQNRAAEWTQMFRSNQVPEAMRSLSKCLYDIRNSENEETWRLIIASETIAELRKIALECPYTRRGFEKPRGYSGDAVLIDFIYGSQDIPDDTTVTGRSIFNWMGEESIGFKSVRWRRDFFAKELDLVVQRVEKPKVAAIGCGHFREGQLSQAVRKNALGGVVAFDQDTLSLDVVRTEQSRFGVDAFEGSVRQLLTGKAKLGEMDFIYAAGLYDYLAEPIAKRLTMRLFNYLRPGGRLIVANFVNMWESGWMEAFMDWWLIYRTQDQVESLGDEIESSQLATKHVFNDPTGSVAYLQLQRA